MKIASNILIPKELVIPVANLEQTEKKPLQHNPKLIRHAPDLGPTPKKKEEKRRSYSQQGTVWKESIMLSEEPSEDKNDSARSSEVNIRPLEVQVQEANQLAELLSRSFRLVALLAATQKIVCHY